MKFDPLATGIAFFLTMILIAVFIRAFANGKIRNTRFALMLILGSFLCGLSLLAAALTLI